MTTALATGQFNATGLVIERGNPEFEATCEHMATEFQQATSAIRAAVGVLKVATDKLYQAFKSELDTNNLSDPFGMSVVYDHHRSYEYKIDDQIEAMKRRAWRMLADRIGVMKVMSMKERPKFEEQLDKGDLPEITPENVMMLILSLVGKAEDFARDAAKEVFDILRPAQHVHGAKYKTNSAFKVGKRVILNWAIDTGYGNQRFRVSHYHDAKLIAIDGVFHLLDGKGILKDRRGPLIAAINACTDGKGETEFFKFKCFKNRNLHLEFKRLDLVKQLNGLGMGSFELGEDAE
jgi:hypothetical protein